jgi:hypothetical protein
LDVNFDELHCEVSKNWWHEHHHGYHR